MSRISAFLLLVTCVAMTLAHPVDNRQTDKGILLVRLVRSAEPGYGGHHGGYHGGYYGGYHGGHHGGYHGGHGDYGGHGGYGGYPSGGNAFSQSSSNAAAINTPFGSAAFSSSNSNAGAYGR